MVTHSNNHAMFPGRRTDFDQSTIGRIFTCVTYYVVKGLQQCFRIARNFDFIVMEKIHRYRRVIDRHIINCLLAQGVDIAFFCAWATLFEL